jgi:hypothetical protein
LKQSIIIMRELCVYRKIHIWKQGKKKTLQYVSTEDMDAIEERIRYAAKEEARQEANKEVMTMVGSMLAAIQADGGACNASNK